MSSILDRDSFGAFNHETRVEIAGAAGGPLSGSTFGVKDCWDIAGVPTGFGSPDWLRTHPPAERTAPAVLHLLRAGARLVGKTKTDELTYSLDGQNAHYGTPINPNATERIPGGSSSGSAVAVAAGLCDFALGSDTGGSVRIPASYCGVFGMRPTHGRIPLDGARPLAPTFDTAGWFTRSGELLERIGCVLLGEKRGPTPALTGLLVPRDALELAGQRVTAAVSPIIESISRRARSREDCLLSEAGLRAWMEAFRILQGAEIWSVHGQWVRETRPHLGPGVKERFAAAALITEAEVSAAQVVRDRVARRLHGLLPAGTFLCMPTAPGIAPLRGSSQEELDEFRARALMLLCPAGLAGLPQVSLPLGELDGRPLGISLIAGPGQDVALLALARSLVAN